MYTREIRDVKYVSQQTPSFESKLIMNSATSTLIATY